MNYSLPGSSIRGLFQARYWSGLPCSPPGDLPDPGVKPTSLMSPVLAGRFFTRSATWRAPYCWWECKFLQLILKIIWYYILKLNICLSMTTFPVLGIFPRSKCLYLPKDMQNIFITVLFIIVTNCKQSILLWRMDK